MCHYDDAYYVLSNIQATLESQFMKRLYNTKAEKKCCLYKKSVSVQHVHVFFNVYAIYNCLSLLLIKTNGQNACAK